MGLKVDQPFKGHNTKTVNKSQGWRSPISNALECRWMKTSLCPWEWHLMDLSSVFPQNIKIIAKE